MAILTLEQARAHCRVEIDYPADQIQPYMDAAESHVIAHLNRAVYTDQAAMDAAQAAVAATMGTAYTVYEDALAAADLMTNPAEKQATIDMAAAKYKAAQADARRTMDAIVVNAAIRAAMLLTLGILFANRETDVVGATVAPLPTGAPELLRPFRVVQMP